MSVCVRESEKDVAAYYSETTNISFIDERSRSRRRATTKEWCAFRNDSKHNFLTRHCYVDKIVKSQS